MEVDEGSDKNLGIYLHWMVAHASLKNEFTEVEERHILMSWLILFLVWIHYRPCINLTDSCLHDMSLVMRKPVSGFATRVDLN